MNVEVSPGCDYALKLSCTWKIKLFLKGVCRYICVSQGSIHHIPVPLNGFVYIMPNLMFLTTFKVFPVKWYQLYRGLIASEVLWLWGKKGFWPPGQSRMSTGPQNTEVIQPWTCWQGPLVMLWRRAPWSSLLANVIDSSSFKGKQADPDSAILSSLEQCWDKSVVENWCFLKHPYWCLIAWPLSSVVPATPILLELFCSTNINCHDFPQRVLESGEVLETAPSLPIDLQILGLHICWNS